MKTERFIDCLMKVIDVALTNQSGNAEFLGAEFKELFECDIKDFDELGLLSGTKGFRVKLMSGQVFDIAVRPWN